MEVKPHRTNWREWLLFFMGNIGDRFTELILKTRQHWEFHTSVLEIKKSTTEPHMVHFLYILINKYHTYQKEVGAGREEQYSFLKATKRNWNCLYCFSTCLITEKKVSRVLSQIFIRYSLQSRPLTLECTVTFWVPCTFIQEGIPG